jgi:hypothetical protein
VRAWRTSSSCGKPPDLVLNRQEFQFFELGLFLLHFSLPIKLHRITSFPKHGSATSIRFAVDSIHARIIFIPSSLP